MNTASTFFSSPLERASGETIAAIATPFGESGIGIVRMSGSLAEPIAQKIFKPFKDRPRLASHKFYYGEIVDPETERPVDEVLLVVMRSPKTYTREDVVEIHSHGGYFILQRVLDLVLKEGARLAEPGEFTRRAFLNGRIDLTRAEAVIDLIKAKTNASLEIANQQRRGSTFNEMMALKQSLVERLALVEAHIDFPEEEIDPVSRGEMKEDLQGLVAKMVEWIGSYEEGRVFREGITCAIIGKTNVGKSSLLNILLNEERAIVTPIPGTTRDVIEEVLNIREIPVRLMDTAGLRRPTDSIEKEGIRRTKERVADSDFVLLVVDGSRALDGEDHEIFKEVAGKKKVVVMNKSDLPLRISMDDLRGRFQGDRIVRLSALRKEGIGDLKDAVYETLVHQDVRISPEHLIIANIRHRNALVRAKKSVAEAIRGLDEDLSLELIAFEIRSALEAIGEIVGETTNEEILSQIFERFCIGK